MQPWLLQLLLLSVAWWCHHENAGSFTSAGIVFCCILPHLTHSNFVLLLLWSYFSWRDPLKCFFFPSILRISCEQFEEGRRTANHNKNKVCRNVSEINKALGDSESVLGLGHFMRLKEWARENQGGDFRGFSFYAFSYDKQYWLYHTITGNLCLELEF